MSTDRCLKSRVRTPRGPFTRTWRALTSTVTPAPQHKQGQAAQRSRRRRRLSCCSTAIAARLVGRRNPLKTTASCSGMFPRGLSRDVRAGYSVTGLPASGLSTAHITLLVVLLAGATAAHQLCQRRKVTCCCPESNKDNFNVFCTINTPCWWCHRAAGKCCWVLLVLLPPTASVLKQALSVL